MSDRKRGDCEIIRFKKCARFDLIQSKWHGRLVTTQNNSVKQIMHTVECRTPTENIKLIHCFPTQESGHQPTQSKDMIEMPMREQNAREISKTHTRLQNLTLCALTTIDQKTIFIMFDNLC